MILESSDSTDFAFHVGASFEMKNISKIEKAIQFHIFEIQNS
ncbi:Protein CBG26348 [Caenorhabditis briggsae]|uniref:Protein CBG26348 n=1 Tax=Caenorhabditis briggsae TaxID=6238 RepID=B6IGB9_CAEBR|nr:Protein CBG26348 [Caenorhabditis briggsae]CAR98949.1 Protein CBG26348 [Caenorhabditis briggsae]